MKTLGLYIHIPFCESKCYYCDFLSFDNKLDKVNKYIDSLCIHILNQKHEINKVGITTIFIGGGTPSMLDIGQLTKLLTCLHENIDMKQLKEFTIECNPNSITTDKIKLFKDYGVNRISLGLQAWQNGLLKNIGRIHTQKDFIDAYYNLRNEGFDNINVDIMFSLPNQTMKMLEETIKNIVKFDINHISCYGLTIEANTRMAKMYENGEYTFPDEILDRDMYHYICDFLISNGYKHYEISNFAKASYECMHNLIYWELDDYIGLGLGAHSYYKDKRYHNAERLDIYQDEALNNDFKKYDIQNIDLKSKYEEYMFLGLRKIDGIDIYEFEKKFKVKVFDIYQNKVESLISQGLIDYSNHNIKLTKKGIDLSNYVFINFLL
ncbi:MAG: hypothetical protein A2Y24_08730 [Clostridiales bacterium GWE2_32_10]|nr:MAG: hypothetical protein A2Y24_08730 [Clostridiales bacterium GWE2_32_10]